MEQMILFCVQIREFISKRILPTLKKATADEQLRICTLSLIVTTLSMHPQLGFMGYGCIIVDGYSLFISQKKGELLQWQSAMSILSISLTVCGMFVFPQFALLLGIASVMFDFVMFIYAIIANKDLYRLSGIESLPKKEN